MPLAGWTKPFRSKRTRTFGIGKLFVPTKSARISERLVWLPARFTGTTLGLAESEAEADAKVASGTFGTVPAVCTDTVWMSVLPPMLAVTV